MKFKQTLYHYEVQVQLKKIIYYKKDLEKDDFYLLYSSDNMSHKKQQLQFVNGIPFSDTTH